MENKMPVILFDGVCHLCAWSVRFVFERDREGLIHFAPLQSDTGRSILRQHGLDENALDSFVFISDGRAWRESDAALRVCEFLKFPWRLLAPLVFLPRFLRDPIYRLIARNRYRWFGKSDACMMPAPELRARFLE